MDTSVKYFTSAMPGAPVLDQGAGTLIGLLDACLVTGFGVKTADSVVVTGGVGVANISSGHSAIKHSVIEISGATPAGLNSQRKVLSTTVNSITFDATGIPDGAATGTITIKLPPAGWEKTFSGTNKGAYRSKNAASSRIFLRVDDTYVGYARVVGYETMTDIDTGEGRFPLVENLPNGQYLVRSIANSAPKNWWIAANDKTVYFGVAQHDMYQSDYLNCAFGDIVSAKADDAYGFLLSMHSTPDAAANLAYPDYSPAFWWRSTQNQDRVMARSYSQIGGCVTVMPNFRNIGGETISGRTDLQFPNGADNGLVFDDFSVYEYASRAYRGRYPGVLASTQNVRKLIAHDSAIPGVTGYSGRTFLWKVIGGGDASNNRGGFAIDVTGPWE